MISSTGDNLGILISCNYTVCDNWMAFLSWYSLSKNLPDAKVLIACNRTLMQSQLFGWTRNCKVPFELHKTTDLDGQIKLVMAKGLVTSPLLVLRPDMVAIRDFEESGFDTHLIEEKVQQASIVPDLCCEVKDDKSCSFVTYSNGWGKFVTSAWIHKMSCPFTSENRYGNGSLTANEVRFGRLWSSVTPLFQTVSRG